MADLSSLLTWIGAMNLWTLALFGAALCADRLFARLVRPAWRALLFLPVLVRLALPVDCHSPLAAVSIEPDARERSSSPAEIAGSPLGPSAPVLISSVSREPAPVPLASAGRMPSSTDARVGTVWLGGTLVLLLGMLWYRLRLRRTIVQGRPARPRILELVRNVEIIEHAHLGPLTFGAWRPVIVLPRALVETLSDDELQCVLAHELALATP